MRGVRNIAEEIEAVFWFHHEHVFPKNSKIDHFLYSYKFFLPRLIELSTGRIKVPALFSLSTLFGANIGTSPVRYQTTREVGLNWRLHGRLVVKGTKNFFVENLFFNESGLPWNHHKISMLHLTGLCPVTKI